MQVRGVGKKVCDHSVKKVLLEIYNLTYLLTYSNICLFLLRPSKTSNMQNHVFCLAMMHLITPKPRHDELQYIYT